jgi:hypothetical protein
MTPTQQLHTLFTMKRFGGNFYQCLAVAGINADSSNRTRIFEAFPEIEDTYGPMSALYSEDLG